MPKKSRNQIAPFGQRQDTFFNGIIEEAGKGRRRRNDVAIWESRLRMSEGVMAPFIRTTLRNQEFYLGSQLGGAEWVDSDWAFDHASDFLREGKHIITNTILTTVATQNAQIMWRRPWHHLRPRFVMTDRQENERQAAELALNYTLDNERNNWLLNARLNVIMAELSLGVMEARCLPEEGIFMHEGRKEELGEVIIEEDPETGESRPIFIGGVPLMKKDKRGKMEPIIRKNGKFVIDTRLASDYFRNNWIHPFDMRFDPEGQNDSQDHDWIAKRMCWKWEDFKKNPLFKGVAQEVKPLARFITKDLSERTRGVIGMSIDDRSRGPAPNFTPNEMDESAMRLWGFKIWDIKHRRIKYLVDGYWSLAAEHGYFPWIQTHPLSFAKIHENPGSFLPTTEIEHARPLQAAVNEVDSMAIRHMERFARWYIGRQGMFDKDNETVVRSANDGRIAYYKKSYNPQDFQPVIDAALDPNIYRIREIHRQGITEMTGSSPESRSIAESNTATQGALVRQGELSRFEDKRGTIAQSLKRNGKLTLDILQYRLPNDMPLRMAILGPNGEAFQGRHGSAQIQGDYEVWLELSDLEPYDNRQEKQDLTQQLGVLGLNAFLSRTFAKRYAYAFFGTQDPKVAEELQQVAMLVASGQLQESSGRQAGGQKPTGQGPDRGRTTPGRSEGRKARETAKSNGGSK